MTSHKFKDFGKVSINPPNVRELKNLIENVLSKDEVERNLEKLLRHPDFTNEYFKEQYTYMQRLWIAQFLILREKFQPTDITTEKQRINWFNWIMNILKEEKTKYDLSKKLAKQRRLPDAPTHDPKQKTISDTPCHYYFIILNTTRKIITTPGLLEKITYDEYFGLMTDLAQLEANVQSCEIKLGAKSKSFSFVTLDRDLKLLKLKLSGLDNSSGIVINKEFLGFFDKNEGEDKEAKKQALIGLVTRFRDGIKSIYYDSNESKDVYLTIPTLTSGISETDYNGSELDELTDSEIGMFQQLEEGSVSNVDSLEFPILYPEGTPESTLERTSEGSGGLGDDTGGGVGPGGGTGPNYAEVNKTRLRNPGFWGPEDQHEPAGS